MRSLLIAVAVVLLQAASLDETYKDANKAVLIGAADNAALPPQAAESQGAIRTNSKESLNEDKRLKEPQIPASEGPAKPLSPKDYAEDLTVDDVVEGRIVDESDVKKPARILSLYAHAAISHIGSMTPYMKRYDSRRNYLLMYFAVAGTRENFFVEWSI